MSMLKLEIRVSVQTYVSWASDILLPVAAIAASLVGNTPV